MPVLKLGRRELSKIPAVSRTTFLYDSSLKGFGLRVLPSGVRTWIVEYRSDGGGRKAPTRRMSLGRTELLSPEKARDLAREILAQARLGQDPAAARATARKAPTVAELRERYDSEVGAARKKSTNELYAMYWRRHVLPAIGGLRVRDVTHSEIAVLHRKIGATTPATANRVLKLLSSFFNWARKIGERPAGDNPARDIEAFPEFPREKFLTLEELMRLGAAIEEAETIGIPWEPAPHKKTKHTPKNRRVAIDLWTAAALRLLLFTGLRYREVLHAKRANVDSQRGLLTLDDSKTGKKTIVLNAMALAVIASLPDTGPYLFPGEGTLCAGAEPKPRTTITRAWERIRDRAALPGARIHDLRHTFASYGAGARIGLPIIGKLLGHSQPSTTARYAHLETNPLRVASDSIAATIAAALTRSERNAA
jgi:integrase